MRLQVVAQHLGYSIAFFLLASRAAMALLFLGLFFDETKPFDFESEIRPLRTKDKSEVTYDGEKELERWISSAPIDSVTL